MDVDIDVPTTFDRRKVFPQHKCAAILKDQQFIIHPAGLYFQDIPSDPVSGLAAIPYEIAEKIGYTKVDFLHLTFLDVFQSKEELRALVDVEPDWSLLESPSIVEKLSQIHNHHELLVLVKPRSVQELADCISLIRPGKRHLLGNYLRDRDATRDELYAKPKRPTAMYFKKSHAISYALTICVQLNLIAYGIV